MRIPIRGVVLRGSELRCTAQLNLPAFLFIMIFTSFGLSALLVESESARPAVGTLLLVGLGLLMYFTYPAISSLSFTELFIAFYLGFFILVLLILLPGLLEGLRSEKGIPLLAASASALSIAARNLRRRRVRTGLTLLSIAASRDLRRISALALRSRTVTHYEVSFIYGRGGGRPFTASVIIVVKPLGPEFYGVAVRVRPLSPYSRFYQSHVQEVVAFVRSIVLEWASLKVRLLAPVGINVSKVVELVRSYQPQFVLLVTRKGDGRLVRELRSKLRAYGLRPPAAEVVVTRSRSFEGLVEEMKQLISKADVVALDSDDGLLSAALALAAAIENRRVAMVREGRVEEVSVDRLLKLE